LAAPLDGSEPLAGGSAAPLAATPPAGGWVGQQAGLPTADWD
jgi:hypothetical protein